MKTGYFARPFNYQHKSKSTMTHIINNYGKVICGYKPHKTMQFQWCSMDINLMYVECKKCKEKGIKILKLIGMGSYIKRDKYAKKRTIK